MTKVNIKKLTTMQNLKKQWLSDPTFKNEYQALQPEYQLARQMIGARIVKNMSQKKLADLVGTGQAVISRLEGMNAKPSFALVKRIASALDVDFTITIPAT